MKLIFICGCMEPGNDGVGDYTRRLAGELIRRGHLVGILALYDKHVENINLNFQIDENIPINVMRLPSVLNAKTRFREAKVYIRREDPEWLSLQFVPHSFNKKGLPLELPYYFDRFFKNYKWHLMVHEPWIEKRVWTVNPKKNIAGILQRKILQKIVKIINPQVIQTSNHYYKEILKASGIPSSILNLPGNIPIFRSTNLNLAAEVKNLGIDHKNRGDWWITGTFGRMRENIDYELFFKDLLEKSRINGKKLAFFSIGEAGIDSRRIFDHLGKTFEGKLLLYQFGSRSPEDISHFFQFLDFGVASVPLHLLGKSGAYASMREHEVEVLVPKEKEKKENKLITNDGSQILRMKNQEFSIKQIANVFIQKIDSKSLVSS